MIEVFKTNVRHPEDAAGIIQQLSKLFPEYLANFDLQDCDHILRIKSDIETFDPAPIITLLQISGFKAEILEDEIVTVNTALL